MIARGLANQERIVLRANMETYTANIGLMLGYRQKDDGLIPLRDRMYWLGAGTVKAGSTIYLYWFRRAGGVRQRKWNINLQSIFWASVCSVRRTSSGTSAV
ncbi:hypothetical protein D3C71_1720140 [compost metagenome]